MNYKVKILLIILLTSIKSLESSRSFFTPRQVTTDPTFELALTDYNIFYSNNSHRSQFYIKPFYQHSNNPEIVAKYFLPNSDKSRSNKSRYQSCAQIRENGTGDINSLWFNLIAPAGSFYSSTLCFSPQRVTYGAVITYYTDLSKICNQSGKFWLLINTAIMAAEHDLKVEECNRTEPGTLQCFPNFCSVFNNNRIYRDPIHNQQWKYGKISCSKLKDRGFDDIQVKLGYNLYCLQNSYSNIYGVVTIPTGTYPTSEFLFEPLVGSRHTSLGAGVNSGFNLIENYKSGNLCNKISLLIDLKYRYSFGATETRSFDLINNGNWSRYLLAVTEDLPLYSFPGINVFTFPVNVIPGNSIDFWSALHYESCAWNVEFGYNLWWRQAEKICPTIPCCNLLSNNNIGIYDMPGVCNIARTASTAQISQSIIGDNQIQSDPVFTPTTIRDINFSSAAHPEVLTNKIYLALSIKNNYYQCPAKVGLASSYEFSHKSSAFSQWAIWGIVGIEF